MACPTCDGTMASLGYADGGTIWHCERCGTIKHDNFYVDAPAKVYVPKLVERCRRFATLLPAIELSPAKVADEWRHIGIAESINLPANRSN